MAVIGLSTNIPHLVLYDNRSLAVIGLGIATKSLRKDITKEAVMEAIKVRYRHFDPVSMYGTEESLGEAIAEALQLGPIKSRDKLFVTSTLWCIDNHPQQEGVSFAVRSYNKERMNQNLEILNWSLTQNDYEEIAQVKQLRLFNGTASSSFEDIFDGES